MIFLGIILGISLSLLAYFSLGLHRPPQHGRMGMTCALETLAGQELVDGMKHPWQTPKLTKTTMARTAILQALRDAGLAVHHTEDGGMILAPMENDDAHELQLPKATGQH